MRSYARLLYLITPRLQEDDTGSSISSGAHKTKCRGLQGGINRFTPEGIELASGETINADIIVCATGFDTTFCPRFPLVGRNGNLQELWRDGVPKAYMSCAIAGLPNYFSEPVLRLGHTLIGGTANLALAFLGPMPQSVTAVCSL